MSLIARLTGSVVVVLSLLVAVYVGFWLCLIGGIVDVAYSFHPFTGSLLALGIAKLLISDLAGFGIFALGIVIADWVTKETKHEHPQTR